MRYERVEIDEGGIPRAASQAFQHVVDTYAGETNKTASVWRMFRDEDLDWRPSQKSSTVSEILKHQLLSERRFFSEFLGSPEPPAAELLPVTPSIDAFVHQLVELARPRLGWLSERTEADWLQPVQFFDVRRDRIWVFWRRVLHSAHHRTQLTVYLRLLDKPVPATYGPTADVTWDGADPTLTVESAERG